MKIPKSQLKKIIREAIIGKSEEELINEGLLDFLGGLFGKLAGWIGGLGGKVESAVDDAVAGSEKATAELEAKSEGKKLSAEDYMKSVAYTEKTNLESALSKLLEAEKAKTWAPKDDSEEAAEAWQKTPDADAAANIWEAVGKLAGSLKFLGNPKYIGDSASGKLAEKLSGKMESPADAIKGVSEAVGGLTRVWSFAEKNYDFADSDVQPPEVLAVLKKIQSQVKKIAGKISASAKEIKESTERRRAMKITKRQLRRIICEVITTYEQEIGEPSEFVEANWVSWLDERGLGVEDLDDLAHYVGAPDRSWLPASPTIRGEPVLMGLNPGDIEQWAEDRAVDKMYKKRSKDPDDDGFEPGQGYSGIS